MRLFFPVLLLLMAAPLVRASEKALEGSWSSRCTSWVTSRNGKTWSRTDQRVFNADKTYTHASVVYRGPSCAGEIYYKRDLKGVFEVSTQPDNFGRYHLDLHRKEEVLESFDEKLASEKDTLSVLERDIFTVSTNGMQTTFGRRVFRAPRSGEDLIDQLAERPSELWNEHIYIKTPPAGRQR